MVLFAMPVVLETYLHHSMNRATRTLAAPQSKDQTFSDLFNFQTLLFIHLFSFQTKFSKIMSTHRCRKRIREAKKKARPELSTAQLWVDKDYAHTFDHDWRKVNDVLERIHVKEVSEKEFIDRFEVINYFNI